MLTWDSAMASSRADWVLGEARLISSARRILVNTGPLVKSEFLFGRIKDGNTADIRR